MKSSNGIVDFWDWVKRNEKRLVEFSLTPAEHADVAGELHSRLHQIDRGLVCDVGIGEEGKQMLVISAGGEGRLFPLVMRVVAAVPQLEHFTVVAFRPRHEGHAAFVLDGFRFATDELMARVKRSELGGVEIEAFIQDFDPEEPKYEPLVGLLIMHALGEYDAVTKVKRVTLRAWPQVHESEGLVPWVRLHTTVEGLVGSN